MTEVSHHPQTPVARPPFPPSADEVLLARTGNYQALRDFFFEFRALIYRKVISHQSLDRDEVLLINDHIRSNAEWSLTHASALYNVLRRYAQQMRPWGHDFAALTPPTLVQQLRDRPVAPPVVRQNSVTLGQGCYVVYVGLQSPLHNPIKTTFRGRTWDGIKQSWNIPFEHTRALRQFAKDNNLVIGESAARMMTAYENNLTQSYAQQRVELGLPLKQELMDFQTVGVDFAIRMRRGIIADEMGLGKTCQAIAAAAGWNQWPILVTCPKSLVGNWVREVEAWTGYKAVVATKQVMRKLPHLIASGQCHFLITNYEGVKTHFVTKVLPATQHGEVKRPASVLFNGLERLIRGIVIDEAHECRNPSTDRYLIHQSILQPLQYRLLLTGTPFVNHVKDLASLVDLAGYMQAFGGRKEFMKEYGRISAKQYETGTGNELRRLNTMLRTTCMIRRQKHQVLTQLPDKFRSMVPIEIDNRKEYDLAVQNLQEWMRRQNMSQARISQSMSAEMLTRMNVLKQLSAAGKRAQTVEYVQNILDQHRKVILFVWHRSEIEAFRQHWPNLLEISGGVKDDVVDTNKDLFQNNDAYPLIVITYKRGGVGHTLTAAADVVFHEFGWNAKDQDQAEDRAHRHGQKQNVNCHYLMGRQTIDQDIIEIISKKRLVGKESTGGTENIETSVQVQVMRRMMTATA